MASKIVTVGSLVGLHARPATLISEAASHYEEDITISLVDGADNDDAADAASSLMIMALGAEHGDHVIVESANAAAVEEIAGMIERDLDA